MEFKQFRQSCAIISVLKFWCFAPSCHDAIIIFCPIFKEIDSFCTHYKLH